MASITSAILIIFLLLGSNAILELDAINCRQYVYAPRCRGISAKRTQLPPLPFRNAHLARRLGTGPQRMEDALDEPVDYESMKTPDDFLQALFRKYWSQPADSQETEA